MWEILNYYNFDNSKPFFIYMQVSSFIDKTYFK